MEEALRCNYGDHDQSLVKTTSFCSDRGFYLVIHGYRRVIHGYKGLYMVIEGFTWLYAVIEGYTWL